MVIVPPHFPFAAGYRLAEQLLTDVAKDAKTRHVDADGTSVPCVSLAVHVHIDSTASTVDELLAGLTAAGELLTAAPYVKQVQVAGAPRRELSAEAVQWMAGRGFAELWALATALTRRDADGRRVLPSAQLHELRTRLRPNPAAAREYLARLTASNPEWKVLDPVSVTSMLLDALALAPFLEERHG
jgi:hypothetical protein